MHPGGLIIIIHLFWIYYTFKSKWLIRIYFIISLGVYDFINYLLFKMVRNASTHGNTIHGWYSKFNDSEKFISYLWFIVFPLLILFSYYFLEDFLEKRTNKDNDSYEDKIEYINTNQKLVQNAINSKSNLEITYKDYYGNKTNRIVVPNMLVLKKGNYFLRAYCTKRKSERNFRIDRIIKVKIIS